MSKCRFVLCSMWFRKWAITEGVCAASLTLGIAPEQMCWVTQEVMRTGSNRWPFSEKLKSSNSWIFTFKRSVTERDRYFCLAMYCDETVISPKPVARLQFPYVDAGNSPWKTFDVLHSAGTGTEMWPLWWSTWTTRWKHSGADPRTASRRHISQRQRDSLTWSKKNS